MQFRQDSLIHSHTSHPPANGSPRQPMMILRSFNVTGLKPSRRQKSVCCWRCRRHHNGLLSQQNGSRGIAYRKEIIHSLRQGLDSLSVGQFWIETALSVEPRVTNTHGSNSLSMRPKAAQFNVGPSSDGIVQVL
jgi:hypothetical protein